MAKITVYVVPHFHYDAAWLETYEGYLRICHRHILDVLNLMRSEPTYRFVLDQVALVRPFAERYPEQAAYLKQLVREGRIELVCGMFVMPDANLPTGESFIRQIETGKRYYREAFGVDVRVGWMLDVFGNHPQIPQLMRRSGFDHYVFGRVMPPESPSEFVWRGIDGSELPCHWMPYHYVILYPAPANVFEFTRFVEDRLQLMGPHRTGDQVMMLNGMDFAPPQRHVPSLAREFNQTREDVALVLATPSDFLARIRPDRLATIRGDFNAVFQGCYSARIEVKQRSRAAELALLDAERWGAVADVADGAPAARAGQQDEELERAWERAMLAQFHDVICGCHTDAVFHEAMRDLDSALETAHRRRDAALQRLASRVTTHEAPVSLVVFNSLSWRRTDIARATVGISEHGVFEVSLRDAAGHVVPMQLDDAERYPDGGLKQITVAFLAEGVPATGYRTYHLAYESADAGASPLSSVGDVLAGAIEHHPHVQSIENEHWALQFDGWTGAITSLRDKLSGDEYIDRQRRLGNVIVKEPDHGDPWEINGPCRGGATVPTNRPFPFPERYEADFSERYGGQGHTRHGDVYAEFAIGSPFGTGSRSQQVRVHRGLRRIDFATTLVNHDEWVRYRIAFPTPLREGRIWREIPFGAVQQTEGEFPAQNWIDYSDGTRGVALLNRGLPGNNVTDGVLMLSVLKCTPLRGQSMEGAFEKGKAHRFEYALLPHAGDWRDAQVWRAGMELNHPLTVVKVVHGTGELPASEAFAEARPAGVVVSAIRSAENQTLVRIYEAKGRRTKGSITFAREVAAARNADLLGQPEKGKVFFTGRKVEYHLKPFEIKTFVVTFARG
jgi:alpha-mannosidase